MEKGDSIAVYTQNNLQFLVAQYGAWKRGAVVVPLNPTLKAKELDYHLNDSGAKVLVCLESLHADATGEAVPDTNVEHILITSELDFLPEEERPAILKGVERQRFEETEDADCLTESNSPTHFVPLGDHAPVDGQSSALSVGEPVPNHEVRLVKVEDPSEGVLVGDSGELVAKGR